MLRKAPDNRNAQSLAVQFRRKRFAFFIALLSRLQKPVHILDIGGTEAYWKMMGLDSSDQIFITVLNLTANAVTLPYLTSTVGDARHIDAGHNTFDIVFSNSVIEHVGTYEDQLQMANEARRVAKRYFIQTPNKYFPLEPHFLFPFFQFLPLKAQTWLLQHFDLGWFTRTPDVQKAREIVASIRLLDKTELVALFPTANLYEEKVLGLTKSFVVCGGWSE